MGRIVLVTGTDTGVGKTVAAAWLAWKASRAGRVALIKAVQTGADPGVDGDEAFYRAALRGTDVTLGTLASFREPLAPRIAARRAGRPLDFEALARRCESAAADHDLTLVEGSGGLLVPLDEERDFSDLALRLEAPLAVVVRPGLGTLNHTALTLEAADRRGLEVPLLICSGASPDPDAVESENLLLFAAMREARPARRADGAAGDRARSGSRRLPAGAARRQDRRAAPRLAPRLRPGPPLPARGPAAYTATAPTEDPPNHTTREEESMGRAMGALFLLATTAAPALAGDEAAGSGIQHHLSRLDALFGATVQLLATFLFAEFGTGVPLIVGVLVAGGVYFSFYFGWLSLRGFKHSIDIIRGRYDNPDDPGEISHFQALTSALSATIGLGNIAGVAIAVSVGGPGAVFWMLLTALIGMSSKLASCTLAVMYRNIPPRRARLRRTDVLPGEGLGDDRPVPVRPHPGGDLRLPHHRRLPRRRQHVPGQPDPGDPGHRGRRGSRTTTGSWAWSWPASWPWSSSAASAASAG